MFALTLEEARVDYCHRRWDCSFTISIDGKLDQNTKDEELRC